MNGKKFVQSFVYMIGVFSIGLLMFFVYTSETLNMSRSVAMDQNPSSKAQVKPGIEVFLEKHLDWVEGKRVGLVTNPTGINRAYESDINLLYNHEDVDLTALFVPEHGIRGDRPAGEYVSSYIDEQTGLPVYSLYGPTWHPTEDMLEDVDVLLFDIQDIGSNVYTYIYTLGFVMESAAKYGKEVIVLDRPNAIGGERVEGPLRKEDTVSYMGRFLLPVRHGMTIGELAVMWNHEYSLGIPLKVAKMEGYDRTMHYEDTGLPWVFPSPNIPTPTTANLYAGTELVKESNASVGLGTTKPFELLGAPWIDGVDLAAELNRRQIDGVRFRAASFTPQFDRFSKDLTTGIQVHVTDPHAIDLVELSLHIMDAMRNQAPDDFIMGETNRFGDKTVQELFNSEASVEEITASWQAELEQWIHDVRNNYLLYGPYPSDKGPYEQQPVIGILPLDVNVAPGEEISLSIHGVDADGQPIEIVEEDILWEVDGAIGIIEDGVFKARGIGEGTISVSFQGISAQRSATVSESIVENIRYGVHSSYTRIVVDLNRDTNYTLIQDGQTLQLNIPYATRGDFLESGGTILIPGSPIMDSVDYLFTEEGCLITMDLNTDVSFETPSFSDRIVIDIMHE